MVARVVAAAVVAVDMVAAGAAEEVVAIRGAVVVAPVGKVFSEKTLEK